MGVHLHVDQLKLWVVGFATVLMGMQCGSMDGYLKKNQTTASFIIEFIFQSICRQDIAVLSERDRKRWGCALDHQTLYPSPSFAPDK